MKLVLGPIEQGEEIVMIREIDRIIKIYYYEIGFRSYRKRRGDLLWLTRRLGPYVVLMFNVPMTKIPFIGFLYLLP